jgi:dihydroorotase
MHLETALAVDRTYLEDTLSLEQLIEKWAIRPYQLFQQSAPVLKEKETANITVFDPDKEWRVKAEDFRSKGVNSPFVGKTLKGQPLGIVNHHQWQFFNE